MRGFTWSLALLLCACGSVKPDADAPISNDAAPGQPGDLVWVRSMSAAFGQGIADGAGGLIYTGSITAPADLGGGLMTPLGAADLVVGDVMASDASYVYQVRHNDASGGQVYGFLQQTDAQGNPLVYGVSYGDVDLGKGHVAAGGGGTQFADGFIGRYGPTAPAWVNRLVGPGEDKILTTAPAPGGEVYAGGWFEQTSSWNGQSLISAGGRDIFLAKMNTFTGVVSSTKPFGGAGREEISMLAGNGTDLIVGCFFDSTLDFGGAARSLTSNGNLDICVARLDASLTGVWATSFGGTGEERGTSVGLDANNDVYVSGTFQGQVAFGAINLVSAGMHDVFVAKLHGGDGTVAWAVSLGTSDDDNAMHLTVDTAGNPVVSGNLGGDAFVTSFDTSNGSVRWQKLVESTGTDYGWTVATGTTGDIYAVVNLGAPVDFGIPLIGPPAPASVVLRITP
jgi:hypothetical protein